MGATNLIIREVDNDNNIVLHLAAQLSMEKSSNLKPVIRLSRAHKWFKEVEKRVPPELRRKRNNKGQTPRDIFFADHEQLFKMDADEARGVAKSGILVASIIATIAAPTANAIPSDDTKTAPLLFNLINALALFTASASLVLFFSVLISSWFRKNKYSIRRYRSLNWALFFLLVSVLAIIAAAFVFCRMLFQKKKTMGYSFPCFWDYPINDSIGGARDMLLGIFLERWSLMHTQIISGSSHMMNQLTLLAHRHHLKHAVSL